MIRISWVVLDFILAAIVAVLGNIVASYFQERFNLTDPTRFVFVAVLFIVCLVLLLLVTVKRFRSGTSAQGGDIGQRGVRVRQQVKHIKREGKVMGVEAEELSSSIPSIGVEQKAGKVAGEMTGVQMGRIGDVRSEDDEESEMI